MTQDDRLDPAAAEALRRAAPPAPFDGARLGERIERSIAAAPPPRAVPPGNRLRGLWLWTGRAAAALALFAGGAWYGRVSAAPAAQGAVPLYREAARPGVVLPAQVPLSIQSAGTGYVASLALLSEMADRLSPEQREQARQVALAVLSGAIAELATPEDRRVLLGTLLSQGVRTADAGGPVVRYR